MKFSEDSGNGQFHLLGYGDGWININGDRLSEGFALTPDRLFTELEISSISDLTGHHLINLLTDSEVDIILLGTGARQTLPNPTVLKTLADKGIGFEAMSTGAACRTYQILVAEHRQVLAILFPT